MNTLPVRLRGVAIAALVGIGMATLLESATGLLSSLQGETAVPREIWALVPGILLGWLLWRLTRESGICSFLGSAGCAEFVGTGFPPQILTQRTLRFQDAGSLQTSITRHFRNREYTYTEYSFRWLLPDGETTCFEIEGSHGANLDPPPTGNYYHFGRAVEVAWCEFLAPKLEGELAKNGFIRFVLGDRRAVLIGPAALEIEEKDGTRYGSEPGGIGSAKLESGFLVLKCREGHSGFFGPLGESGSLYLDLSGMHNSRLFLIAFEKILGVRVD